MNDAQHASADVIGVSAIAGINIKHQPYGAKGNGQADDTPALRAAIRQCMPAGVNLAHPLATMLVPQTLTVVGTDCLVTLPRPSPLPLYVGMPLVGSGWTPSTMVPPDAVIAEVLDAEHFRYRVAAGTTPPGEAGRGWSTIQVGSGPRAESATLDETGRLLTITMPWPLPRWLLGPNPRMPTLDPGSAIRLLNWDADGGLINNAPGSWYTVTSIERPSRFDVPNVFTIALPDGAFGLVRLGDLSAWGVLAYAYSDSGVICTPTPVLLTSEAPAGTSPWGRPLIVPAGYYYVQHQDQDAQDTPIVCFYQVSLLGAGQYVTTFRILSPAGQQVPMTPARPFVGVPAFDLHSRQVGMRHTGYTLNWLRPAPAFLPGTAIRVSGGLATEGASRQCSLAPVVNDAGQIAAVRILDPGLGLVAPPDIAATSIGGVPPGSIRAVVTDGAVTGVTGLPVGTGGSRATPRLPWAGCDGIRLNGGVELDHVIINGFDANLVLNSYGGGMQIHDCQLEGGYYNAYWFMDGSNDRARDVQAIGAACAAQACHANRTRDWAHHTPGWPNAVSLVQDRWYLGQCPIALFFEEGYGPSSHCLVCAEFAHWGVELVNLAAIYAADAARYGYAWPLANCTSWRTPLCANFWTPLGPGALPQLGADADLSQRYMAVLGGLDGYARIDHSWGWQVGSVAGWKLGLASGPIDVVAPPGRDTSRMFEIVRDREPGGAVRYHLDGGRKVLHGVFTRGAAPGDEVTLESEGNVSYVQRRYADAPIEHGAARAQAEGDGGLQLPFTLLVTRVWNVPRTTYVAVRLAAMRVPGVLADPGLVAGRLAKDLPFTVFLH
jgi:hypothetical protein